MTGYAVALGACGACGATFGFNPHLVPSVKGEPICAACIVAANRIRDARGLEPFHVLPGAYEPCEEGEL